MKDKIIILIITIILLFSGGFIYLSMNPSLKSYTNILKQDISKASASDVNEYKNGRFVISNKDTLQEIYNMLKNSAVQDNDINISKELKMKHIVLPSLELTVYYSYNEDIGIRAENKKELLVTLKGEDRKRLYEILSKIFKDYFLKIFDESNANSEEDIYYNGSYVIDKSEGIQLLKSIIIKSNETLPLEKVGSIHTEREIVIKGQDMGLVKGNYYYLARDLIFIKITEEDFSKITNYLDAIKK